MLLLRKSLLLFSLLLWYSCQKTDNPQKEMYTCSYHIYYATLNLAFIGYTKEMLAAVIVEQYKANSNFSEWVASDTLDASTGYFEQDTAYASIREKGYYGFIQFNEHTDYRVSILATKDTHEITHIASGPDSYSWTQDYPCSMGAGQARIRICTVMVNGKNYEPFQKNTNHPFVYLSR